MSDAIAGGAGTPAPVTVKGLATRLVERVDLKPMATIGSLAAVIGGLLVLAFFVRIRFMPDADLASSTAILFAVASVGLASLGVYLFIALMPGVAASWLLRERGLPPDRWIDWLLPGIAFVVTAAVLAMAAAGCKWLAGSIELIWFGASSLACVAATWRAKVLRSRLSPASDIGVRLIVSDFVCLAVTALVWFLAMFAVLQITIALGKESQLPSWLSVLCAAACAVFITMFNLAVS